MEEEILRKLKKVLNEDVYSEYQVVYILSRIRKYLEMKNKQSQYKILNFYCNWALHSKIERTEPMGDKLRAFIDEKDDGDFVMFRDLHKDLHRFLNEHNLPDKIIIDFDKYTQFMNILVDIYSDTPLEVYPDKKKIITISRAKGISDKYPYSISYKIE